MAAIGSVMGFSAVFFGFFVAALLALFGVVATAFSKSSRALPFGPWLGLAGLVMIWLRAPLKSWFAPAGKLLWQIVSGNEML
jgi:prepilin signal peptidase PulO-like enzyme (type II secretory pathway)